MLCFDEKNRAHFGWVRAGSRFASAPEVDLRARFFLSNHIN
jgi:hypothetical protein